MKLSKVLLSSALALSLVFGAIACAAEEDDDELEAISGSNNNYSINFTNNGTEMYRAYHSTYNQHLGGLCQIALDEKSYEAGDGTIGYIFDLESNPSRAAKAPRTLCIVGYNLKRKGIYVSHYTNVTDIQAANFGTDSGAEEVEYLKLNDGDTTSNPMILTKQTEGEYKDKYVFTVNVNGKTDPTKYTVEIYDGLVGKADLEAESKPTAKYTTSIPLADLYPTVEGRPAEIPQKAAAVYVNVFQGKTMNATWHYDDTYAAAEIIEE